MASVGTIRSPVHPSFPNFSSTYFEILIWSQVYTFSRWHGKSSFSFIAIRSRWPILQTKIIQIIFWHQDQSFKFGTQTLAPFYFKSYSRNWGNYSCTFCIFRSFLDFSLHVFRYQMKLGIYILCQYDFQSSVVVLTCLRPEVGQIHLSASMGINLDNSFNFGAYFYMVIFLIPYDFCDSWAKLGPKVATHLQGRINGQINRDPHQRSFSDPFF